MYIKLYTDKMTWCRDLKKKTLEKIEGRWVKPDKAKS